MLMVMLLVMTRNLAASTLDSIVHISEFRGKSTLHPPRRRLRLHVAMLFLEFYRDDDSDAADGDDAGVVLQGCLNVDVYHSNHSKHLLDVDGDVAGDDEKLSSADTLCRDHVDGKRGHRNDALSPSTWL